MPRLILFFLLLTSAARAQTSLYFPPLAGSTWATTSPASLGWCPDKIDSLYGFLQAKNTKAFIVLKDGRIVLERYFGTFTQDSLHMWASAGKTLAAFAVGIAQEEGLLNINNPVSTYLGTGWTSCPPAKEALITVRHQLTMSTGLNDGVSNLDCTDPACLTYLADAGTRWSYHNAPYTLTHRVVDSAAGAQTWQQFHNMRIALKTGIVGAWITSNGYNDVFFSKPRAAARFGLLMLAKGMWNGDTVLGDTAYLGQMVRPSQTMNRAYGYLTWLNSQTTYMIPGAQITFNGPLIPAAPADLYAALGKDDQKIHVVPSQNLVVVRMGNDAGYSQAAPSAFDNEMWVKLNAAMCSTTKVSNAVSEQKGDWKIFPQPATTALNVSGLSADVKALFVHDLSGRCLLRASVAGSTTTLSIESLPAGNYVISDGTRGQLFSKQ